MKVLRVLFTSTLLLTLLTGVAQAAAADRAVGFVQVLSHVDARLPIAMQSKRALDAMMPRLLAAKAAGQVLEFHFSPSTGILGLVYRPSLGALELGGINVYADEGQALSAVSLPHPVHTNWAAADTGALALPGVFHMMLYDQLFDVSGLPAGVRVLGTLRDATGMLLGASDGTTDGTGYLVSYFVSPFYAGVNPGYKLTFKVYNGTTLLYTYNITAPNLKFTSIDKANSIVKGTGPAGKPFKGIWTHELWNASRGTLSSTKVTTTSGSGTWSVDFGTNPIHGYDFLQAYVMTNANFEFGRDMSAPAMYCAEGDGYCSLYGFAFKPAALQAVHGGVTYNASGVFTYWGQFGWRFRKADGTVLKLAPGDKVSGTSVLQWTLPTFTASIAYSTDVVSGKAPPNRYFDLTVQGLTNPIVFGKIYSHSNSTGDYATDFTSKMDLVSGRYYGIAIFLRFPSTGNSVEYDKAIGP